MYGLPILLFSICFVFIRLIIFPVVQYFIDSKGFRRYPNMSPLSGITNIPFMLEAKRGFRSRRLAELHQTHPVIRIGPNSLSYGDVRAIKDIYGYSTKCKKDDFYSLTAGTHSHLADVVDKAEHARKRKVLSSAYAIKNLEGWEFKVADKVQRLFNHLDQNLSTQSSVVHDAEGPTVDLRAWTNFFTMDAIADIGLSSSLGFLDKGDDETTAESIDGTSRQVRYRDAVHSNLTAQSHLVWAYEWFPVLMRWSKIISSQYNRLIKTGSYFDEIVLHQARRRLKRYQAGENLDDFFQALMDGRDGMPHNLPWGEIVAEISIMLNAGSVSTAIAINNAMFMLLKHPEVLRKLREEIDAIVDPDEEIIPYDKIKDLPYLRAVLDESMRVYPPTSFGLPRKTPAEGCNILGQWVAGETSVSMSAYVAHRDKAAFPDPEEFIPERWLGEEGKQLQPFFVTFSVGARGCIGRNISYLEQIVLIASLVHRYEFALPSPSWEQDRFEHFNLVPGPMPLRVWKRRFEAGY